MRKLKLTSILGVVAATVIGGAALADEKPATTTESITIPNSTVTFDLVKIPAGKVTIKDKDGKDKEVEVKSVWIGKLETRWDEFDIFWQKLDLSADQQKAGFDAENRPSKPYAPPDRGFGHNGWPAGSLMSAEAEKYVKWLSKVTKKKYRLPTVAEWTAAAKAGGKGEKLKAADLKEVAWFVDNAEGAQGNQPMETGKKKANAWGLHDMLGNVAEWCVREDGTLVAMGGSFQDDAADVHADAQAEYDAKWQKDDPQDPKGKSWMSNGAHIGVRVVRED
ncbi:MAG TPA: SUMF1/EgtB/PvdO family nonheme iron enzyme [Tepidisphaeraceae bacterium]|nr:SUMF1/EgtB/PvdO family nonheme iron enzyme [Tepidisphaeraceae bacterium]